MSTYKTYLLWNITQLLPSASYHATWLTCDLNIHHMLLDYIYMIQFVENQLLKLIISIDIYLVAEMFHSVFASQTKMYCKPRWATTIYSDEVKTSIWSSSVHKCIWINVRVQIYTPWTLHNYAWFTAIIHSKYMLHSHHLRMIFEAFIPVC